MLGIQVKADAEKACNSNEGKDVGKHGRRKPECEAGTLPTDLLTRQDNRFHSISLDTSPAVGVMLSRS